MLLALLEGSADGWTGYALLEKLRTAFAPHYHPSPGAVYPALAGLSEELLLEALPAGRAVVYRLTPSGLDALNKRDAQLRAIEKRTGVVVRPSVEAALALERFVADVLQCASDVDPAALEEVLRRAAQEIRSRQREKQRVRVR